MKKDQKTLRETARLYDIHEILGLDPKKSIHVCPFPQHVHSDRPTPSLGIKVTGSDKQEVQRFHCFGNCGLSGDSIDAMGYLRIPDYDPLNGDHVRMAVSLLSQGFTPLDEPIRVAERVNLDPELYKQFLPAGERVIEYAKTRGLTAETLAHFNVGQSNNAMAMPTFEFHTLKAIKYRATWKNPNVRFWTEKGSRLSLFNHDRVAYTDEPVLVLKGEIPTMLCDQLGLAACAPVTGEGTHDMTAWVHLFGFAKKVVVVGDNDGNPETRRRMQDFIVKRAESLRAEVRFPPEQYKDIDLWILSEPEIAIPTIKSWLGG